VIVKLPFTEKVSTEVIPEIKNPHYISPDSWIIGQVKIGDEVSIFPGVVIRGDIEPIEIGNQTNIQEHSILHTTLNRMPCRVGNRVTIGHRAILHSAQVSDLVIVGMGSILLDDCEISEYTIIGAGSVVTIGKKFPPNSLIIGSPAKVVRELTEQERKGIEISASRYVESGKRMNLRQEV
jgi:carbonic anhydrase/acetyltransferase-like protein (isoleucine patch superfamily)